MNIIGLHGRAHSGKDTACAILQEWGKHNGVNVQRDAFADRLKVSAMRALGYQGDDCIEMSNMIKEIGTIQLHDTGDTPSGILKGWTISGREYLQLYGTEAHRDVFDPDFWINAVLPSKKDCDLLVITDVRFPNEAEAIRAQGGGVWRIVRPSEEEVEAHASEVPLDDDLIDGTIMNDGNLNMFGTRVRLMMMTERVR